MADEKILTEIDDVEMVEIDKIPPVGTPEPKIAAEEPESEDDEDEEEHEDERLAHKDDDEDDSPEAAAKRKQQKRRERQRLGKERAQNEIRMLREANSSLEQRLSAVEGTSALTTRDNIDRRLEDVRKDLREAEYILTEAMKAGNGEDFTTALRLRDEAKAAEADTLRAKSAFTEDRRPAADTAGVEIHKQAWLRANPWYLQDPGAASIANQIDGQVMREGFNPATPSYWQEVSRRLNERFKTPEVRDERKAAPGRKKPPPQGDSREYAPVGTRTQVWVTPERKAAMILAGSWDDLERRRSQLKAYAEYDRNRSAEA